MSNVTVQKILNKSQDEVEVAIKYYSLLFAINNIHLPKKEIELLAFTAVRGSITPMAARLEFIERFQTTKAFLAMLKGRLIKKGLLTRIQGKDRVAPKLLFNFKDEMVIQVTFQTDKTNEINETGEKDV